MSDSKNILIIAYNFPPESGSAAFRPYFWSKHLSEMGWKVHILTVANRHYLSSHRDFTLLTELDPRVDIVRTSMVRPKELLLSLRRRVRSAGDGTSGQNIDTLSSHYETNYWRRIKDFTTEILACPDANIGWLPFAVRQGYKCVRREGINVICTTGNPWSSFLIGSLLKQICKIPLVLDFRDPWVANAGFVVKNSTNQRIERFLERVILDKADMILANTEEARDDFLRRYEFLNRSHVHCLPNGFEEYYPMSDLKETKVPVNKILTLTHTGALYFSRNPTPFIKAVGNLVRRNAINEAEIRVTFVGEMSTTGGIKAIVEQEKLRKIFKILPRCSYREVIQMQMKSDILLLFQQDYPLQVPRKLYDYMAARKPILAITNESGPTARLIKKYGLGIVAESDVPSLERAILELHEKWKRGELPTQISNSCDEYLNRNLTIKLNLILLHLVNRSANRSDRSDNIDSHPNVPERSKQQVGHYQSLIND